MKKRISILFLFIFFIYGFIGNSNIIYANIQNNNIEFLDIHLGENLKEIESRYNIKFLYENKYDKVYSIHLEEPYFYGFKIKNSEVGLWFYKDMLYCINLDFNDNKLTIDKLKNKFEKVYGKSENNTIKINDNVLLNIYNNGLHIKDIKIEKQIEQDKQNEQFKEFVIYTIILISCIILFTYLIIKLISKFNKPMDKYYILITNMLFSIYLLFLIINKYNDKYILPLFITIFNIYFVTTNIKKVFYYCLYIILNIAFIFDIIKIKIIHGDGIILVMLIILTLNILLGINLLRIWIKNNKR